MSFLEKSFDKPLLDKDGNFCFAFTSAQRTHLCKLDGLRGRDPDLEYTPGENTQHEDTKGYADQIMYLHDVTDVTENLYKSVAIQEQKASRDPGPETEV